MAGYSGTPLWKKLGYKPGLTVYLDAAPPDYLAALDLPPATEIRWVTRMVPGVSLAHVFVISRRELEAKARAWRTKIDPAGAMWVSWPKQTSGMKTDVTEGLIRDVALPLGWVDVKVCAVDAVWSGLKLVIRKEQR